MEDLLREDDFLIKENSYNPSKYFRMFYWGAVVHFIVAAIVIAQLAAYIPIVLLMIISPIFMVFGMVFSNRRIVELTIKTILISVCFLLCIYYAFMIVVMLVVSPPLDEVLMMTSVFAGYFILCSAVIVPVVKWKKKKSKMF